MSLWNNMRKGVNRVAGEAEKQASIAKLSMEVNTTKGKIKDKLEEMGQTTLNLYREGAVDHASLEGVVGEIGKLEARVKELEEQIAAQKGSTAADA